MERLTYVTVDKSGWGEGPWQDEPDKEQWQDEATGLACLIVRHSTSGHLCGYVGVDDSHPLHGKEYMECLKPGCDHEGYCDHDGRVEGMLDAHGGVTFSAACDEEGDESRSVCHVAGPGEPEPLWWFGFDAAHAGDRCPGTDALMRYRGPVCDEYRTVGYMKGECADLARQLADLRVPA